MLRIKNINLGFLAGASYCRSGVNVRNSATNELIPYIAYCPVTCSECTP